MLTSTSVLCYQITADTNLAGFLGLKQALKAVLEHKGSTAIL